MRMPPIPSPLNTTFNEWASKIAAFLKTVVREIETPGPKIIQLEHLLAGASATQDGLLAYDPVAGTVVVSKSGAWYPVQLGAALPATSGIIVSPRT